MKLDRVVGTAVGVVALAVYVLTSAPEIYWEDSGEIATAAATLGLPHSPSFPLYLILARPFVALSWTTPGGMAALFSAVFGALAVVLLYVFNLRLLRTIRERDRTDDAALPFAAAAGALAFAFTFAMWINSVRAEVYTLAAVGVIALYLCALALYRSRGARASGGAYRVVYVAAFLIGLTAGDHSLTVALLLPGLAVALFLFRPASMSFLRLAFPTMIFGILGFSVYAFLPVRSSLDPAMDWGDPETFSRFLDAVLRRRSLSSAGLVSAEGGRSAKVASIVVMEFGLAVFWLGVVGAVRLARRSWRLLVTGLALYAGPVLWSMFVLRFMLANYDARAYLLPSLALWGSAVAVALDYPIRRFTTRGRIALSVVLAVVIPSLTAIPNIVTCDLSGGPYARLWGEQILSHSPYRALVMPGTDSGIFSLWHLIHAEGRRPDAAVVGRIIRLPSYLEHVERQYPQLNWPSRAWMDSVDVSEQREEVLARRLAEIIMHNSDRVIVWESGSDDAMAEGHLVPVGPVWYVSAPKLDSPPEDAAAMADAYWESMVARLGDAEWFAEDEKGRHAISRVVYNTGRVFFGYGDIERATTYNRWALELEPEFASALSGLGVCAERRGDVFSAEAYYRAATGADPANADAWINLSRMRWYVHGDADGALHALAMAEEAAPDSRSVSEDVERIRGLISSGRRP